MENSWSLLQEIIRKDILSIQNFLHVLLFSLTPCPSNIHLSFTFQFIYDLQRDVEKNNSALLGGYYFNFKNAFIKRLCIVFSTRWQSLMSEIMSTFVTLQAPTTACDTQQASYFSKKQSNVANEQMRYDKQLNTRQFLNLVMAEVVFPIAKNNLKARECACMCVCVHMSVCTCYVHVGVMRLLTEVNSLMLPSWDQGSHSIDSKHLDLLSHLTGPHTTCFIKFLELLFLVPGLQSFQQQESRLLTTLFCFQGTLAPIQSTEGLRAHLSLKAELPGSVSI